MKKTLSLLLVLAMVLSSFGFAFADDAKEATPAEILNDLGVLKGNASGDLMLKDNLKRQDMVVMLSRLLGVEDEAKAFEGKTTFTDVTDKFYVPYVAWAEAKELTNGKAEGKFGFNELVTEQQVAQFMLRALGYGEVKWDEVPAKAVELKLVEKDADLTVDATRERLAVLTLTALKTKVKDSDKTLAETLELKLPAPEKLEVKEVKTSNLKEIEVVFNKDVDSDSAENLDNYETDAGDIQDINYSESEHVARILLESKMKNKEDYEITIDGVKDDKNELDITKEFKAIDNAIPEVVEVVGLGTKAVKVTMSEPVEGVSNKNFKLDGKAAYGTVQVAAGRDIILKTHTDISIGEHTLTVTGLKDYAGFKSVESDHGFEVIEDKENPTVIDVNAKLERVALTFSKDVDSISKNKVYWKNGSTKVYADKVNRLAGNKFEILFKGDNGLPAHETTLYVEGVVDYSGNKLENPEVKVTPTIDTTRPVVRSVVVKGSTGKIIEVKFSKAVNTESPSKEKASALNIDNYKVLDKDDKKQTISEITNKKGDERTFQIVLGKALDADEAYTLKISGIKDNNKYSNYMVDYSEKLSSTDYDIPELKNIAIKSKVDGDDRIFTITLFFNRSMDIGTLSNPENYLVEIDGSNKLLSKLDYDIDIKDSDGDIVELTVVTDKKDDEKVTGVAGLGLKGSNGKELSNYGRIVKPEYKTLDVKNVVAKSKTKVEINFTKEIKDAPEKAFKVSGVTIEDVSISGTKVTLKLSNKLGADAYNHNIEIDNTLVVAYDGDILKKNEKDSDIYKYDLEDEIAPSIKAADAETVGTKIIVAVTFDENLDTEKMVDTDKWASDLTVKRINGDKAVDFDLAKYTVKEGKYDVTGTVDPSKLAVIIEAKDIVVDKTAFSVAIEGDARFIVDTKGNEAAESDARTGMVDKIEEQIIAFVAAEIRNIPALDTLTPADETKVNEAKKAYDGLTADQKKLVKAEDVTKLNNAVARIAELKATAGIDAEAAKYEDTVEIGKDVELGVDVTKMIAKLKAGKTADKDVTVAYVVNEGKDNLSVVGDKIVLLSRPATDDAKVKLTFTKGEATATKDVTVKFEKEVVAPETYAVTFKETNKLDLTVDTTIEVKDSEEAVVADLTKVANGTYSYTITKTGYQTLTGSFKVESAAKEVSVTLAK